MRRILLIIAVGISTIILGMSTVHAQSESIPNEVPPSEVNPPADIDDVDVDEPIIEEVTDAPPQLFDQNIKDEQQSDDYVVDYEGFKKPAWAPPSRLFGPVWSVLYAIIAISFGFVFYKVIKKELSSKIVLPFILNLVFNFSFTPLQFGLENNFLAAVDIALVLITTVWFMRAVYNQHRWVVFANIPYLLWVTFATALQFTITYMNW